MLKAIALNLFISLREIGIFTLLSLQIHDLGQSAHLVKSLFSSSELCNISI